MPEDLLVLSRKILRLPNSAVGTKWIIILAFVIIHCTQLTLALDSGIDLDNYSEAEYHRFSTDYEDNLRASFAGEEHEKERSIGDADADDYHNENANQRPTNKKSEGERYAERAYKLKCDNPWFWNAPKCVWIDMKAKHVITRTKMNAGTSAWFLGSIVGFVVVGVCSVYCLYRIKMKKRLKMLKLREQYAPGRILLPSGKIAEYTPTEDENKAYEDLVKAIIIQEMSFMI